MGVRWTGRQLGRTTMPRFGSGTVERAFGVAALLPVSKLGPKELPLIFPSEDRVLPVECGSQAEAAKAAMQSIDRGQEPGIEPEGTLGSKEETPEIRPAPQIRRFARFSVALPAVGWAPQFPGMPLSGMVRHIAAGGLMVEFPVEVVPGSTLRIHLETRQAGREMAGKVVWTAADGHTIRHGVSFPEPHALEFLDESCRDDTG